MSIESNASPSSDAEAAEMTGVSSDPEDVTRDVRMVVTTDKPGTRVRVKWLYRALMLMVCYL